MKLKELKEKQIVKIGSNIYVIIFAIFLVWMLFFDENSFLTHRKFDKEIEDLENSISYYNNRIKEDKATINKLQDSIQLEQFAREKYFMKKDNEDIYIIEFDSLK